VSFKKSFVCDTCQRSLGFTGRAKSPTSLKSTIIVTVEIYLWYQCNLDFQLKGLYTLPVYKVRDAQEDVFEKYLRCTKNNHPILI
jgi:hypothetical protein